MKITIDKSSGFCFGVKNAVAEAEKYLKQYGHLYTLGDIVHNNTEVERLREMGMEVIDRKDLQKLRNTRVLIRAHGEPPETYLTAQKNNIEIIDATCPIVLKLQSRVKESYREMEEQQGQLVIFGKKGHAEVEGLAGQTQNNAIIIDADLQNINQIDFTRPITLYSQTTMDKEAYINLIDIIKERIKQCDCSSGTKIRFQPFNTICGQVSNRGPHMARFARQHDVVIFVSGKKSSNGKYLYGICRESNPLAHFISDPSELKKEWFDHARTTGICGATSTPAWLLEEVARKIKIILSGN
ncbi:MAG: 4-hydroxy-3-methylbut-2-enyl diphosphate reductase [Bacteroidota bacterium]